MHEETYPDFFTPRDEELSRSSSEEKSSEFDWLERKLTRKQKYEGKIEQVLCKTYFFLIQKGCLQEQALEIYMIVKKITTIYMRLFTLCSYLKTKESYDRWVIRRLWGFRQQISKAKYLKMLVTNIGKLQENTAAMRARGLRNFAAKRTTFRSPRLISQSCEIFLQLGVISFQWL